MDRIRVAVTGGLGRMGREVVAAVIRQLSLRHETGVVVGPNFGLESLLGLAG